MPKHKWFTIKCVLVIAPQYILLVEQHLAIYGRGPQPEFTQNMLYTTGLEILSSFRICIWFLRVIGTKRAT